MSVARGTSVKAGALAGLTEGSVAGLCGAAIFALGLLVAIVLVANGSADFLTASARTAHVWEAARWSALLLAMALPPVAFVAFFAGVAASDPAIGGQFGRLIDVALRAGSAMPPVTFGAAACALAVSDHRVAAFVHAHALGSVALALAAFNAPILTQRVADAIRAVPPSWRVAAAAAGASPVWALARLVLPSAWPRLAGVLVDGAGKMLGETALVAMVLALARDRAVPAPLAFDVWRALSTGMPGVIGAETLLLVVAVAALRLGALALDRVREGEMPS